MRRKRPLDLEEKIVKLLNKAPSMSINQLCILTGERKEKVWMKINNLKRKKMVKKRNSRRVAYWGLTDNL